MIAVKRKLGIVAVDDCRRALLEAVIKTAVRDLRRGSRRTRKEVREWLEGQAGGQDGQVGGQAEEQIDTQEGKRANTALREINAVPRERIAGLTFEDCLHGLGVDLDLADHVRSEVIRYAAQRPRSA